MTHDPHTIWVIKNHNQTSDKVKEDLKQVKKRPSGWARKVGPYGKKDQRMEGANKKHQGLVEKISEIAKPERKE